MKQLLAALPAVTQPPGDPSRQASGSNIQAMIAAVSLLKAPKVFRTLEALGALTALAVVRVLAPAIAAPGGPAGESSDPGAGRRRVWAQQASFFFGEVSV